MIFRNSWHMMLFNPGTWLASIPIMVAAPLYLAGIAASVVLVAAWMCLPTIMLMSIKCMNKHLWYMKLWAWMIDVDVAETIDFENKKQYVFFQGDMCSVHTTSWSTYLNIADLVLLPNGAVHPGCGTHFVYLWRPVDTQLLMQQALSYDLVDWTEWAKLTHSEKFEFRQRMMLQLQVASEPH